MRLPLAALRTASLLATLAPLLGACGTAVVAFDKAATDDTGSVSPAPALTLSAESLDLGYGTPDQELSATLTASNSGTAPLDLAAAITDGASHYTVDFTATTLQPGDDAVLTVRFAAADLGTYGGTLTLTSSDPDRPERRVVLTAHVALDEDGDGYADGTDCDDTDPAVHPDAIDTPYDGVDTDCSGGSDYDADADGHDAEAYGGDDCDDTDAAVSPDADESWYDGVDQDCDQRSDYDADGDGHDSDAYGGDDCDDTDAARYPGNLEDAGNGVDDDCDGAVDEAPETADLDGDGFSEADGDCDDANADISPEATEIWYDGIDQDCAGDGDYDQDADGYDASDYGGGDCLDTDATVSPAATDTPYDGADTDCSGGSDYDQDGDGYDAASAGGDDCDDTAAAVNPGAAEVWYDGVDADCSGGSDYDQDGDTHDTTDHSGDDCNDLDPGVYGGAAEVWYDGIDADCSGGSDYDADGDGHDTVSAGGDDCDDTVATTYTGAPDAWYDGVDADCSGGSDYDRDGDGHDSDAHGGDDCNDIAPTVYTGAPETWYDGVDSDCSGGSDYDQDGDGQPAGVADCDDLDATAYRGATETCDGLDNDCDGTVDDGVTTTSYADTDGDGYGDASVSTTTCGTPAGYVTNATDCDDTEATANPGAAEVSYDRIDNDCNGRSDDMTALAESDWTVIGTSTSHAVGAAGATALDDVDGDGNAELVLAVTADDVGGSNAGALAWHDEGLRAKGVAVTGGYLHLYGESADDNFGTGFGYLGDIDGWDYGEPEFVAGAGNDDDEQSNGGAVYIFDTYGSSWYTGNRAIRDLYQVKIVGSSSNEYFGSTLLTGDYDADGGVDLLVGAWGKGTSRGYVYFYADSSYYWYGYGYGYSGYQYVYDDGDAGASIRGTASGDKFGTAMVSADVDGDGDDDAVICAPEYDASSTTSAAGGCWLVDPDSITSSSTYTVTSVDDLQVSGVASNDGVGSTAQGVDLGDIDGDGLPDLAVGAPGYDGSATNGGAVAVFLSSALSGTKTLTGAHTVITGDGGLGSSVQIGTVGSGPIGLLAGAPTAGSSGQGMIYALSSTVIAAGGTLDAATDATGSWRGESAGDALGTTLSNVYDVDGDGTDDVMGGASGWDSGSTSAAGKAYVLPVAW